MQLAEKSKQPKNLAASSNKPQIIKTAHSFVAFIIPLLMESIYGEMPYGVLSKWLEKEALRYLLFEKIRVSVAPNFSKLRYKIIRTIVQYNSNIKDIYCCAVINIGDMTARAISLKLAIFNKRLIVKSFDIL